MLRSCSSLYHVYLPFKTVDDDKGNTNMDELLIEAPISSKDELMDLMNAGEKQRHGKHGTTAELGGGFQNST